MKLRIKNGSMIEVEINSCFSFAMGEDLVETREKFLDCMGQQFDGAIYQALEKNDKKGFTCKSDIEAIRQRDAWLKEKTDVDVEKILDIAGSVGSYDALKEIADYVACSENIDKAMQDAAANRKRMECVLQTCDASLEKKPGYSKLFK